MVCNGGAAREEREREGCREGSEIWYETREGGKGWRIGRKDDEKDRGELPW